MLYVEFAAGEVTLNVGGVFATVKVALGPAASEVLLALSVATPAATVILAVPSPVQLVSVTVRELVPDPPTDFVQLVPVVLRVMLLVLNETLATPLPAVSEKLSV